MRKEFIARIKPILESKCSFLEKISILILFSKEIFFIDRKRCLPMGCFTRKKSVVVDSTVEFVCFLTFITLFFNETNLKLSIYRAVQFSCHAAVKMVNVYWNKSVEFTQIEHLFWFGRGNFIAHIHGPCNNCCLLFFFFVWIWIGSYCDSIIELSLKVQKQCKSC